MEAFIGDCRRGNLSLSTIENYSWWLRGPRLTAYRLQHAVSSPADFDAAHLRAFEGELVSAGLRPSSVDSLHRHLKHFIGWHIENGGEGDRRVLTMQGPRLPQEEPDTLSVEDEAKVRGGP